jgi:hypothetical protein
MKALQPEMLFDNRRRVTSGERQILHELMFGFSQFIFFQLYIGLSFIHSFAG